MKTTSSCFAIFVAVIFALTPQHELHGQCITEPSGFAGGDGTKADPFQICNATQLSNIRNQAESFWFVLTDDIDLSGGEGAAFPTPTHNWDPIALVAFEFDGGGHSIENLKIDHSSPEDAKPSALFAVLSSGHIRNVTLNNVVVSSAHDYVGGAVALLIIDGYIENVKVNGTIHGRTFVGGVVGVGDGDVYDAHIKNCHFEGAVSCDEYGAGGIVGDFHDGNIEDCSTNCMVSGDRGLGGIAGIMWPLSRVFNTSSRGSVVGTGGRVGGIVGSASAVVMANCYSQMSVVGDFNVGGLVGVVDYPGLHIDNCYAAGSVSGNDAATTNGLVGCFTHGPMLANDCYWDIQTTGQVSATSYCGELPDPGPSTGFTRLPTAQMQMRATFDGTWDFCSTWGIDDGNDYPRLVREFDSLPFADQNDNLTDDACDIPGDFTGDGHVGLDDLDAFIAELLNDGDSVLADINGDTQINGLDLQVLINVLL